MVLKQKDGRIFAQGACKFRYDPITEHGRTCRIIVPIHIEGLETEAILDTGAVYFICSPEIANLLNFDPVSTLESVMVQIRGLRIRGSLYRRSLKLLAEEGQSLELEVTVLVPNLEPNEHWNLPSFMGMHCCLERMRFAVDPATETFYFGSTCCM